MPSLFALGQHQALLDTRARLHPSFLDVSTSRDPPEHTVGQFAIVREALVRHTNIQVHLGKTPWNSVGEEPRDSSRCSPRWTPRTRAARGTGPSQFRSKAWWSWEAPLAAATSSPRSSPNDCRSRTASGA